ncbi:MAG: ABC transporter permease [Eubacteriales bacterium]|nr:ABC transporter permease [Eubacteriales bacterium]
MIRPISGKNKAMQEAADLRPGTERAGDRITGRKRTVLSTGFILALIVLWQLISMLIGKSFILPSPIAVLESLWENRVEIFTVHFPATLKVVVYGGVLSVVLGAAFAVLMDWNELIERALYPILTLTQTIPVMCIAPAFVLWFGYTVKMRVIVVILVNFFTVTVNLYDGFASTNPNRQELLQTYGASRWQIFTLLRMPTALPYFFTALKVAVPWSVVGAAVAEWLGAPDGLGTYSRACMMNLDAAGLLAPLIVLTAFALILNLILNLIEGVSGGRFF